MIADYTTIPILQADQDVRAPLTETGTYICLFAWHRNREQLVELANSRPRSRQAFLKQVDALKNAGGKALWKGGEVEPSNLFRDRLDTLSSNVNSGDPMKVPTAAKMHDLVLEHGGFVLVLMIPVWGYSAKAAEGKEKYMTAEQVMMHALSEKHGINFDNISRTKGRRGVKKDWTITGKKLPFNF